MGRHVKTDRVEEGARKTVRTTDTWRQACTRIRKSCYCCRGCTEVDGWMRMGRMQKPHGRQGASTQAMQTQLLVLFCKVVGQTFGPHCIQKAIDDASTSWKCSRTERLSVASQADGMAFYRWKVRVSRRCIYRYLRWVGASSKTGRTLVEMLLHCSPRLKKECPLFQVILFPEGQAVELLQGHAENPLEVLGRQVSLEKQNKSRNRSQQKTRSRSECNTCGPVTLRANSITTD